MKSKPLIGKHQLEYEQLLEKDENIGQKLYDMYNIGLRFKDIADKTGIGIETVRHIVNKFVKKRIFLHQSEVKLGKDTAEAIFGKI